VARFHLNEKNNNKKRSIRNPNPQSLFDVDARVHRSDESDRSSMQANPLMTACSSLFGFCFVLALE
jgi:hypothetical protein